MADPKKSKGTSCRIDCPGRVPKSCDDKSSKIRHKRQYRRKRHNFVYKPEEEIWHEPYMQPLRGQFSSISLQCDSMIELPWKDIAVMSEGGKLPKFNKCDKARSSKDDEILKVGKNESTGLMKLPWSDLVIDDETVSSNKIHKINGIVTCDSSVEIPWSDLTLESTVKIQPVSKEKTCRRDDIEVPWDAILVPRNLIIEPNTKKKHPSSNAPSRKSKRTQEIRNCRLDCSGIDK